jgi:hypothetical protein
MNQEQIVAATAIRFYLLLGIGFVWLRLLKPAIIDYTRQHLFGLREELFSAGEAKLLPFHHPAYQYLEHSINRAIRNAHEMNNAALAVVVLAGRNIEEIANLLDQEWSAASSKGLSNQGKQVALHLKERLSSTVTIHMMLMSPVLIPIALVFATWTACRVLGTKGSRYLRKNTFFSSTIPASVPGLRSMEAFVIQRENLEDLTEQHSH